MEELAREIAGDDGLVQGDEDGMAGAFGVIVALGRALPPGVEEAQGGGGVGYLVAEIVGDAAEGVDALEVGADRCWGGRRWRRGSFRSGWW